MSPIGFQVLLLLVGTGLAIFAPALYLNFEDAFSKKCAEDEEDIESPTVTCPRDLSFTINTGVGGSVVTWDEPTVTDNSGVVSLVSNSHNSGDFFITGETTVTYEYGDAAGNTAYCSFTVTIVEEDIEHPSVTCPSDLSFTINTGVGGRVVTWDEPTVTDNSGVVSLVSNSHNSGDFFTTGETFVIYVYEDAAGNWASCYFTVTIAEDY